MAQYEKTIEEIVLSSHHCWNSATRRVMVGHPSRRTEENPADAGKLETKVYVLVNRAPMKKKIGEAAGLAVCVAPYEAVACTQPFYGFRRSRHGVVAKAQ